MVCHPAAALILVSLPSSTVVVVVVEDVVVVLDLVVPLAVFLMASWYLL